MRERPQVFATGSCGKKMNGALCRKATPTAPRVTAPTASAATPPAGAPAGRATCRAASGTCSPVDRARPDPRGVCKDRAATCGTTRRLRRIRGCANYAATTLCRADLHGHRRRTRRAPATAWAPASPPACRTAAPTAAPNGACTKLAQSNSDCDSGAACVRRQVRPQAGSASTCGNATECPSEPLRRRRLLRRAPARAPAGAARCPARLGNAPLIAAGAADPRGVCTGQRRRRPAAPTASATAPAAARSTQPGTTCARPRRCASERLHAAVDLQRHRPVRRARLAALRPLRLQRHAVLQRLHGDQRHCIAPNVCNGNSCGLKTARRASCSAAASAQSAFCAQGVCCDKACDGACQSCALTGTLGTCTNVPAGARIRRASALDQGGTSCGTNGKCHGRALPEVRARARRARTRPARRRPRPSRRARRCDGAGRCVTPAPSSCFPYQCGAAVCKNTCTADADCAPPAVCIKRLVRPQGERQDLRRRQPSACRASARRASAATPPATAPASPARCPAPLGTCSNVADGAADPQGTCHDAGRSAAAAPTGSATASGACRLYAGGTPCAPPSCPAGSATLTLRPHLRRHGELPAGHDHRLRALRLQRNDRLQRGLRLGRATACRPTSATRRRTCAATRSGWARPARRTPTASTGNSCVDGVCCSASACPACQACNVIGSPGNCANVAGQPRPSRTAAARPTRPAATRAAATAPASARWAGPRVSCGTASCVGVDVHAGLALQRRRARAPHRPPRPARATSPAEPPARA